MKALLAVFAEPGPGNGIAVTTVDGPGNKTDPDDRGCEARDRNSVRLNPEPLAVESRRHRERKTGAPPAGEAPVAFVGLTGFEPATPCPLDRCATKLRHSPYACGAWTLSTARASPCPFA